MISKDSTKVPAALFDLDGTLVDVTSIRYLVEDGNRDFDSFHRESINCPPNPFVLRLITEVRNLGFKIIIVTARSDKYKKITDMWLAINEVECDQILMRPYLDQRNDVEVKTSMYKFLEGKFDIQIAVDDRQELVDNWRKLGIPEVININQGNNG